MSSCLSFSNQTELVFGLVDTFTLEIDVSNAGENAFLAKMKITFPDELKAFGVEFVNVSVCFCLHFDNYCTLTHR